MSNNWVTKFLKICQSTLLSQYEPTSARTTSWEVCVLWTRSPEKGAVYVLYYIYTIMLVLQGLEKEKPAHRFISLQPVLLPQKPCERVSVLVIFPTPLALSSYLRSSALLGQTWLPCSTETGIGSFVLSRAYETLYQDPFLLIKLWCPDSLKTK